MPDGPKHLNVKLTRSKLESLVDDPGSIDPCRTRPAGATLACVSATSPKWFWSVVMTRMPKVQSRSQGVASVAKPRKDVNPNEAEQWGRRSRAACWPARQGRRGAAGRDPLSLGIETLGGVATKLIEKNTTIPTCAAQVFSTAEDNQTGGDRARAFRGEREQARYNKSLAKSTWRYRVGAARRAAGRGDLDIDANGILHVSAKDKKTGKSSASRSGWIRPQRGKYPADGQGRRPPRGNEVPRAGRRPQSGRCPAA